MSGIEIRQVDCRRTRRAWLSVPSRVHAGDNAFIEPLRLVETDRISPAKNPFFAYGDAALFVAYRDGRAVGRISAQVNREHLRQHNDATGHFGFFDCVDDPAAAHALVQAAEQWLCARGMRSMRGPFSFTINQESGLLVSGFEHPPAILTGHAPRWLGALLEAAGLSKAMDLHAFRMRPNDAPAEMARLARLATQSGRVRVRNLDMARFDAEVKLILDIFNDAWSENWSFVPFTPSDVRAISRDMRPILRSKYGWIAEIDGEPAAMMIVLPDINEVARSFRGRLLPLNWLHLVRAVIADRWTTARVPLLGIRKKHRAGLLAPAVLSLLTSEIIKLGKGYDLDWIEYSWILETNRPMINLATLAAGPPVKTWRIYEKPLAVAAG